MRTIPAFLYTCCILIFSSIPQNSAAQYGLLDYSFGADGIVKQPVGTNFSQGYSMVVQPDGKILMCGVASNTSKDFGLARFLSNGNLDNTFGTGGMVITDFSSAVDFAYSMVLQPDGKILVGGYSTPPGSAGQFALVRYNSNGTLDNTFGTSGKVITGFPGSTFNIIYAMAVQPDGKIVVAGETGDTSGIASFALARFETNGTPDTGFDGDGFASVPSSTLYAQLKSLFLQADGKIVALGLWGNSTWESGIFRFNADGSMDSTLIIDLPVNNVITDITQQPDGKIIAVGRLETALNTFSVVQRFEANGDPDLSFGSAGDGICKLDACDDMEGFTSVELQSDGKIVTAGVAYQPSPQDDFMVARINANGTPDMTFGTGGLTTTDFSYNDYVYTCALQPDGKVLVGGIVADAGTQVFAIARYHSNTVGLSESNVLQANVYPNPVSETLNIAVPQALKNARAKFTNMSGQLVMQQNNINGNEVSLDVSGLTAGVLILEIVQEEMVFRTRIVKE